MRIKAGALRHRAYRVYFFGQMVSLAGTWMQQVAIGWLIYRLTGSALLLTFTAFAAQIPMLVLGFWTGSLADRWDRRKTLMATQLACMVQALLLFGLAVTGYTKPWHLVALSLFIGVINAFDTPMRQVFVANIIPLKRDLPSAIALNSTTVNIARIVGPSLAGIILGLAGEAACFGINALSYIVVFIAIYSIKTDSATIKHPKKSSMHLFREGWQSAMQDTVIRRLLVLMIALSFFGSPYTALLPMVTGVQFGGGSGVYAMFLACSGAGALVAGLFLVARPRTLSLIGVIKIGTPLGGAALLGFAVTHTIWLAEVCMFGIGFGLMLAAIGVNTLIQARVSDHLRGRVMTLYSMALYGSMPLGALVTGWVANRFGVSTAYQYEAVFLIVLGLLLTRNLASGIDGPSGANGQFEENLPPRTS
jgi:MFS family permease